MQLRTLVGPTIVVLLIITATGFAVYSAAQPPEKKHEPDIARMNAKEFKAYISEEFREDMKQRVIFWGVVALLIICAPSGMTDGMSNRLLKTLIFMFMVLVGNLFSGDHEGNEGMVIKIAVVGGGFVAFVGLSRLCRKYSSKSKLPAHIRWSYARRQQDEPDDPESLRRLRELQSIANGPPPQPS